MSRGRLSYTTSWDTINDVCMSVNIFFSVVLLTS